MTVFTLALLLFMMASVIMGMYRRDNASDKTGSVDRFLPLPKNGNDIINYYLPVILTCIVILADKIRLILEAIHLT